MKGQAVWGPNDRWRASEREDEAASLSGTFSLESHSSCSPVHSGLCSNITFPERPSLTALHPCPLLPLRGLSSWPLQHLHCAYRVYFPCLLSGSLTRRGVLEGDTVGGQPPSLSCRSRSGAGALESLWQHLSQQTYMSWQFGVWWSPVQAPPHAPSFLSLLRSPLVKAVLHTCRAMHASLPGKADVQQSALCHCERASGHLWSSLNVSGATCDPTLNHVSGGLLAPLAVPHCGAAGREPEARQAASCPKTACWPRWAPSLVLGAGMLHLYLPFWPGLCICSRQLAQPPRPCRPALGWPPPLTCTQHAERTGRILLAGSCGAL